MSAFMNQEKYIGMDVHDATISAAVKNAQGKLLMECVLEVTRSAETARQPAGGLRSAQERADEGWQPERSGGCTQFGGATTHQPSQGGVPREAGDPCFKRIGTELFDAHQG